MINMLTKECLEWFKSLITVEPAPAPDPIPEPPTGLAQTSILTAGSPLTQRKISWTFAADVEVGQFVNGDYFVIDPGSGFVVGTVSPATTGSGGSIRNGSMVNPSSSSQQGYHGLVGTYTSGLTKTFPLTVTAGDSLISTIGKESDEDWIDVYGNDEHADEHALITAAEVLTILSTVPFADNWRPASVGTVKTLFRRSDIDLSALPSNSLTAGKPATSRLATAANWFKRPWLDHKSGATGRQMHPIDNMPNYGLEISQAGDESVALLMLDYSVAEKTDLATNLIQVGIDLAAQDAFNAGWPAGGGNMNGRKEIILMTGIILDDTTIKTTSQLFGPDGHTYYGVNDSANEGQDKIAYWGKASSTPGYYEAGCTGGGAKDFRPVDDDADGCPTYRNCCTSRAWAGSAIAFLMMGEKATWNHNAFYDFVDRWMGYGLDAVVADEGVTPFPGSTSADFIKDMWTQYRGTI